MVANALYGGNDHVCAAASDTAETMHVAEVVTAVANKQHQQQHQQQQHPQQQQQRQQQQHQHQEQQE